MSGRGACAAVECATDANVDEDDDEEEDDDENVDAAMRVADEWACATGTGERRSNKGDTGPPTRACSCDEIVGDV